MAKKVWIDTSAFYALFVAEDRFHEDARKCFERLVREEYSFHTTWFVVIETISLLWYRKHPLHLIKEFMGWLEKHIEVEIPISEEWWKALKEWSEKKKINLSPVDYSLLYWGKEDFIFTFDRRFRNFASVIP